MERSVPALLGLARVSGLGTWVNILYQGFRGEPQRILFALRDGWSLSQNEVSPGAHDLNSQAER